jgi:hypothetical protein
VVIACTDGRANPEIDSLHNVFIVQAFGVGAADA